MLKVGNLYTFDTAGKPVVSQTKGSMTWLCVDIAANGEATFLWQGDNLFPDGVAINDAASESGNDWGKGTLRDALNPASGSAEETTLYTKLGLTGAKGNVKEVKNEGDVYSLDDGVTCKKYGLTTEKIWLPSVQQVFGVNTNGNSIARGDYTTYSTKIATSNGEESKHSCFSIYGGDQWQLFRDMSTWQEVLPYFEKYVDSVNGASWFRTPSYANNTRSWFLKLSGTVGTVVSTAAFGAVPAFTLLP